MSSFQVAQTITGLQGSYKLIRAITDGVHRSTVFKAKVLSGHKNLAPGSCVLIKTSSLERKCFIRQEYNSYCKPAIASSPFIRKMYDIIGHEKDFDEGSRGNPPCLVLEWLDQTLTEVSAKDHRQNDALLKALFEGGLGGLSVLKRENLVHTDLKPDNILVSGVEGTRPIAKIGDFGSMAVDGFNKYQVQPYAMRAPEVWRGYGCSHRSDVWSLAATVLVWAKPGILGMPGVKDYVWPQLWCTTKLMALFPEWDALPVTSLTNELAAMAARGLLTMNNPDNPDVKYIEVSPLEDELVTMGISREAANVFRRLLVTGPENRPDADTALASPEFQALVAKVEGHV